jgi:hypothetical protein
MGDGSDTVWVGKAEDPVRDLTNWEDATKPATYAASDRLFKNSLGAKTGGNHLVSGSSVGIGIAYCTVLLVDYGLLYYTVLYYTILYYTILYCTILYYTIYIYCTIL